MQPKFPLRTDHQPGDGGIVGDLNQAYANINDLDDRLDGFTGTIIEATDTTVAALVAGTDDTGRRTRAALEDVVAIEVVESLAVDSTPRAAAAAAVETALSGAGVLHDAYPIQATSGYLWVIQDAVNNVLFGINSEGKLEGIFGDAAQVPYWSALVGNPLVRYDASVYGYLYAITDAADNVLFGIKNDGSVELPGVSVGVGDGTITLAKLAPDSLARLPQSSTSYDRARLGRNLYGPSASTAARPLVSTVDGVCWGDSMTDGWPTADFTNRATMAYPAVLDSLLPNATVHNGGSTGQSSDEIALRQGGLVLMLNVVGGTIPASGGVTVAETSSIAWRLDRNFSENRDQAGVAGIIAGVPGRLTRTNATLTFTRTTSGAAVPLTGPQQFISTEGELYKECWQILFAGRNDIGYASAAAGDVHDRVVNAYIAMIDKARASVIRPRILIAGVLTATSEAAGSTNHTLVKQINATLEALYPTSSTIAYARDTAGRDLRGYLVNQAIVDLGITPTTTDLAKIAGDTLPPSLMATNGADAVHYSVACAAKVAAWWKNRLVEKGWATA